MNISNKNYSNYSASFLQNQYWKIKKSTSHTLFLQDPEKYVRHLSPGKRSILDALLHGSNIFESIYYAQATLGRRAHVTREWVNKVCKEFQEHGLIYKTTVWRQSCQYYLNPLFYSFSFRYRVRDLFVSCSWIPPVILSMFAICNDLSKLKCKTFQSAEFTLSSYEEKNIYINSLYNSQKYRYESVTEVKITQKSKKEIKRRPLKQFKQEFQGDNPIPGYIRDITELSLTKWGQIKLCAFPEEAIQYARSRLRVFSKAKDPFSFFFKSCCEYCETNEIRPDWMWIDALANHYQMPANAPMLLAVERAVIQSPAAAPIAIDIPTEITEWEKSYDAGDYSASERFIGFQCPPFLIKAFLEDLIDDVQKERLLQKYPKIERFVTKGINNKQDIKNVSGANLVDIIKSSHESE